VLVPIEKVADREYLVLLADPSAKFLCAFLIPCMSGIAQTGQLRNPCFHLRERSTTRLKCSAVSFPYSLSVRQV
ncbi:MAG: hypothetical protein M3544_00965, partial [Pseudomonadota bacterium]|nr:hypothetical protein [Pseudomonadota bacterium]